MTFHLALKRWLSLLYIYDYEQASEEEDSPLIAVLSPKRSSRKEKSLSEKKPKSSLPKKEELTQAERKRSAYDAKQV